MAGANTNHINIEWDNSIISEPEKSKYFQINGEPMNRFITINDEGVFNINGSLKKCEKGDIIDIDKLHEEGATV